MTNLINRIDYKNNLEIIFPEYFVGIKSFDEFREKYKDGKGNIPLIYSRIIRVLNYIQKDTGEDPIAYLYYEYYENELSTIDIYDKYHLHGNYDNKIKDTFNRIFVNIFDWKLRDETKVTNLTKKKLSESRLRIVKPKKEEKKEEIKKIEKVLKRISKNKDKQTVDRTILKELSNNLLKIKYILNIRGYISENNFEEILLKLANKYGLKKTSKAVSSIISEEGVSEIVLNPGRLSEMKKK